MKACLRIVTVFAILACAYVAPALAAEGPPAWTYVEAGYLGVNPDDLDGSGDNVFAGGSFGLFKSFHIGARYIDGSIADDVDQTAWSVWGGWHGLLGEKADLVAEVHWSDVEFDDQTDEFSDDGYGLTGGVRWKLAKIFELDGFVNWIDYSEGGSTEIYEVRGLVDVWKLSIGASYEFADEFDQYGVFARFNFGR